MRGLRPGWRTASRSLIAVAAGGVLIAGLAPGASATSKAAAAAHANLAGGLTGAQPAPRFVTRPRAVRLPAGQRMVCGRPAQPGEMACQAIVQTAGGTTPAVPGVPADGYSPASLRSAYNLSSASLHKGSGETVAIVDAYSNPDLAKNLASYRHHFKLPACTTTSHCLRIVNQAGKTGPLPKRDPHWGLEESLDLDMVSAICPRCHILLVEASNSSTGSLGAAENTAVAKGARFVSNSWSGGEFTGQDAYNHYFNHPGDAVVFASGDFGYGTLYPTDTQYVTAVGGTALVHKRSGKRAWTESVWGSANDLYGGTGSGCSTLEAKPSWQHADDFAPNGCLNRTENDVSADADLGTGVAVWDSYQTGGTLMRVGGTSVATPIITSVYALAGNPARGTYPAEYPYRHSSDLNAVKSGKNGTCEPKRQYLCHGERGYNGPAGLGTPNGLGAFSRSGLDPVTVVDPGTQDVGVGAGFKITIPAVDSDGSAKSLSYSAKGLPSTLKISSAPRSLDGIITGTLPSAGGIKVTVTAKDKRSGRSNSTQFEIYAIASLTATAANTPGFGPVNVAGGGACLSASAQTAGTAVITEPCSDASYSQNWEFVSGAKPGSAGTVEIAAGICLDLTSAHKAVLAACSGSAGGEQWEYQVTQTSAGQLESLLYNPASRDCLNGGSLAAGSQVAVSACTAPASQNWALSGTSLVSGLTGTQQCLSSSGTTPEVAACAPGDAQESWLPGDGNLQSVPASTCLAINGSNDGTAAVLESCATADNTFAGVWIPGPAGELINAVSGKCLNAVSGHLQLADCYRQPGEIWALN
jgi:hypothetical protein